MAEKKTRRSRSRRTRGTRRRLAAAGTGVKYEVDELPNIDLMASLDRVAKMLARVVGEVARKNGATTSQLQVVAALARTPDGLTAKNLAAALAIRPGSLTGMLDTLEDRGILQRERVKGDARQQRIVLLEGARPLVEALSEVESRIDALFAGVGEGTRDELAVLSEQTETHLRRDSSLPMPAVLRITSPVKLHRLRQRAAQHGGAVPTISRVGGEGGADAPSAIQASTAVSGDVPKHLVPVEDTPSHGIEAPAAAAAKVGGGLHEVGATSTASEHGASTVERGRRGMLSLSSRVLSAVDAVRKRRED